MQSKQITNPTAKVFACHITKLLYHFFAILDSSNARKLLILDSFYGTVFDRENPRPGAQKFEPAAGVGTRVRHCAFLRRSDFITTLQIAFEATFLLRPNSDRTGRRNGKMLFYLMALR
ncbi:MAG: hypothetical protein JSS81_22655 [Acidobacteria bacterium]|nr:hypothetical protein [Acidobacteriota bacterium]